MKLGFSLPMAGPWATPDNQVLIAQRAETLGYHSLWVFQRLLYAVKPQNDYPPLPGQPWPKSFERVMDPLISLAFVAGVTSRIRLGTSVLIMPYYTPVLLAKQLATLDVLSRGRLDVGLGLGWSMDEFEAVGVPYAGRGKRGDEFLRCLKAIWTEDPVEFAGEFYRVPRARVEPRPVQTPHPPITIGGYGPRSSGGPSPTTASMAATCRSSRCRRSWRRSRPRLPRRAVIHARSTSSRAAASSSMRARRERTGARSGAISKRFAKTLDATPRRD